MDRDLVTFEDVAVYFTGREWKMLNEEQKTLYKEVMNDNYQMILSLNRPDIILNIDLGCDPYVRSHSESDCTGSWKEKNMEDGSVFQQSCTDITSNRCEMQVKRPRRYPRVNPVRWIKKDKKKKNRLGRSSHRISRRSEEKQTSSGDYEDKTSLERKPCDPSTYVSQDPARNLQEDPLPDEPYMKKLRSEDLNSQGGSDDKTAAESSHHMAEAVRTCEVQEDVSKDNGLPRGVRFPTDTKKREKYTDKSSLPKGMRFTVDTKNCEEPTEDCSLPRGVSFMADIKKCEKPREDRSLPRGVSFTADTKKIRKTTEGSHRLCNMDSSHIDDDMDSGLDAGTVDSRDVPVFQTSDILTEANSNSPNNMGTPKPESERVEKRSPTTKKRTPQQKKDRHVKFSEVVTMILIGQHSEERSSECHKGGVKLRSKPLPICNNVNEGDEKKEVERCSTGHVIEEDKIFQGQGVLPRNEERTKQARKRATVSSCQSDPVESPRSDTTKCSKKRLVEGMGISQCAPELKELSPAKRNVKRRHELHSVETYEAENFKETCLKMKSEDRRVDTCSGPPETNMPLNSQEQNIIKSYSCTKCGKISHWSKLSVHQRLNIERSIAHMCRMCGRHMRNGSATASTQTIHSLSLTIRPGETSQPVNCGRKITDCSSVQPNTERILSAEKKQRPHKDWRNGKTTEKQDNLVPANDQKIGANSDHCKKPPPTSQDDNKSNGCSKSQSPGTTLDRKVKTFSESSASKTSTRCRTATKCRKVDSKSSVEQPGKIGEGREDEVCAKREDCFTTEQRNHPSVSDQQKNPKKSSPSVLQKTQDIRNPRCIMDPGNSESDKDCTKCGKSLTMHVMVNPENPGEESCVPHLKKCQRPLEEMEPFQCKQQGKMLQHYTVHTPEHPNSLKECEESFGDDGNLKVHMRLHTKQKDVSGSLANQTITSETSGQASSWSIISSKNRQIGKIRDSKKHVVCTESKKCFITKHRNHLVTSDYQKKPTKGSSSVLQKTEEHPPSPPKIHSTYVNNTRNPEGTVDPENPESNNSCTKYGRRLVKLVNLEHPGEGGQKHCVLRLKKRKRLLEETEPFQCKQCGKTFTRHFTLLQHRTVHTGERPYSCKECGKSFRDGGYLKVHMRLHTKEKPYTCSECGKCFGQNSALVVHLRTHTDERPFQCIECGKSFSDRSTLRHHQMIHSGEKPFTCSFCGKKFTQQAHVKRHEKMHTGERPFGCTICEKRFVDRTKLRKHELIHNREPKN